jgi:DDE superfamily endonuclease
LIARRQQVAWVNGPFPTGTTDIRIFRAPGGLKSQLRNGEYLFADQGYRREPETLCVRNPRDTDAVKEAKQRSLARQESFNARLKSFKILAQPFRGKHAHDGVTCHDSHKTVVEAIVVLLQYEIENGHLLLHV